MTKLPQIKNRVLIGGPPSTGSSLLRRILNRHSKIYSGEESHLFCKSALYEDWEKQKHRILKSAIWGLRTTGWHHYTGIHIDDSSKHWTRSDLSLEINKAISFVAFGDTFFSKSMHQDEYIYIEKTPCNVFTFEAFVKMFEGQCIRTKRDPLDNIASLMARGLNLYEAVSRVLVYNAFGEKWEGASWLYTIQYENLVENAEYELHQILKFLNLEFEPELFVAQTGESGKSIMQGWNYDETAGIGNKSLNRFEQLDNNTKMEILGAVAVIQLKDSYINSNKLNIRSVFDLKKQMPSSKNTSKLLFNKVKKQMHKDMIRRTLKLYPTHFFNYPIELKV